MIKPKLSFYKRGHGEEEGKCGIRGKAQLLFTGKCGKRGG
jgi:hypothetical protein